MLSARRSRSAKRSGNAGSRTCPDRQTCWPLKEKEVRGGSGAGEHGRGFDGGGEAGSPRPLANQSAQATEEKRFPADTEHSDGDRRSRPRPPGDRRKPSPKQTRSPLAIAEAVEQQGAADHAGSRANVQAGGRNGTREVNDTHCRVSPCLEQIAPPRRS